MNIFLQETYFKNNDNWLKIKREKVYHTKTNYKTDLTILVLEKVDFLYNYQRQRELS